MIVIEPPSTRPGEAVVSPADKAALSRFLKRAQRALDLPGEVTVLLTGDARMRELNRGFRGKNKTTDVLSFPAGENGEGVVGDLAISLPVAAAQAAAHGHGMAEELRILTLHGLLHLAGFDHEVDAGQMRAREADLRAQFKLPVSLIERTLAAPAKQTALRKPTVAPRTAAAKSAPKKSTLAKPVSVPDKTTRKPTRARA